MDEDNLQQLYELALSGDRRAEEVLFSFLLVRFQCLAKRRVGQAEADELAQETCITVLQKYRNTEIHSTFGAWAYGVFKNKALNFKVRTHRHSVRTEEFREYTHPGNKQQLDPMFLSALQACLEKISKLGTRFAPILWLIVEKKSKAEICRKLRISDSAYDTNFWRARKYLDNCLEDAGF